MSNENIPVTTPPRPAGAEAANRLDAAHNADFASMPSSEGPAAMRNPVVVPEPPAGRERSTDAAPALSPRIMSVSWGQIEVEGLGKVKDVKVWPGGGRAWDWGETGTQHSPGIQMADAQELLDRGAAVIVLSRGMQERLAVSELTVDALSARGVKVHVAETRAAVALYNDLAPSVPVGGLFHSTC